MKTASISAVSWTFMVLGLQTAFSRTEECNKKGFYCLPNGNQFRECIVGETTPSPTSPINNCPGNYVCSTNCNSSLPCTLKPCAVTCTVDTLLPFDNDPSRYYKCTVLPSGEISVTEHSCATGTEFVASTQKCEARSFTCKITGRFANPTNCSKYHLCLTGQGGAFIKYDYNCPKGSFFKASTTKCVPDSAVCTHKKFKRSSLEPTLGISPDCKNNLRGVKWEDPNNCSYFYICAWIDGYVKPVKYRCLDEDNFDPIKMVCSKKFACTKPERAYNNDTVTGWSSEFD